MRIETRENKRLKAKKKEIVHVWIKSKSNERSLTQNSIQFEKAHFLQPNSFQSWDLSSELIWRQTLAALWKISWSIFNVASVNGKQRSFF